MIGNGSLVMLICIHILSRVLSAFSVIMLPSDNHKGTLNAFANAADKTIVCIMLTGMLLCCEITAVLISPVGGGLMLLNGAVCFLLLKRMAQRDFEGMRGDMAGFFLQINELVSMACIIIAQKGDFM